MEAIARLIGSATALAGTLSQLAVIAATVPGWSECVNASCKFGHPGIREEIILWRPFIDNIGEGDRRFEQQKRCPGAQIPGTAYDLDHAPLPAAFRPFDQEEAVVACVRVDAGGTVRSVRLISGSASAQLDRQLVRTIAREWRFSPRGVAPAHPSWHRVRLSSGFPSPEETFLPL